MKIFSLVKFHSRKKMHDISMCMIMIMIMIV
jgi:hypothetical protein